MSKPMRIYQAATTEYKECKRCGARFAAHKSMCTSCKQWDTEATTGLMGLDDQTVLLSNVEGAEVARIKLGLGRIDELFGGGIAHGSVTLLGGIAGAGKSTLSLQMSDIIAGKTKREVLYVAAEESAPQIKDRATRLRMRNPGLLRLFPMGNKSDLGSCLMARRPCAVFLDSLPGFVSSLEEAVELCSALKSYAVELDAPFIVIDHVTKADDFAGLEKLKHTVDTTMTIYNEPTEAYPELREMTVLKNRYGRANISMQLLMTPVGLEEIELSEDDDED